MPVESRRFLPLAGGQFAMLSAFLAYSEWQGWKPHNEALLLKEHWLFPHYWQIMPLVLFVGAVPTIALLMRLARTRALLAFLLTLPIGCMFALVSSICGRILEGRNPIFDGAHGSQILEKCLFLLLYSVDRLAGWQFLTIFLAGTFAIARLPRR